MHTATHGQSQSDAATARGRRLALVAVALLGACSGAETGDLTVALVTDFRAPQEVYATEVSLRVGGAVERQERPLLGPDPLEAGLTVARFDALGGGEATLEVTLLRADRTALLTQERTLTLDGSSQSVSFTFSADCALRACPIAGLDPTLTECVEGSCVAPSCAPDAPTPCHDGPAGVAGVGACLRGALACVDGVTGACEGAVQPTDEAAVDVDEDCDGVVDEDAPLDSASLSVVAIEAGALAAFTGSRRDGEGEAFVYLRRFDHEGAPLGPARAVAPGSAPQLARSEGVWLSYLEPSGALVDRALDASGAPAEPRLLDASGGVRGTGPATMSDGAMVHALLAPDVIRLVVVPRDGAPTEVSLNVPHDGRAELAAGPHGVALVWGETAAGTTVLRGAASGSPQSLGEPSTLATLAAGASDFSVAARTAGWVIASGQSSRVQIRELDSGMAEERAGTVRPHRFSGTTRLRDLAVDPSGDYFALATAGADTRVLRALPNDDPLAIWQVAAEWTVSFAATRGVLAATADDRLFVGTDVPGVSRETAHLAAIETNGALLTTRPVWER